MKLESFQLECFQLESFHLSWKPLTLVKNFPIESSPTEYFQTSPYLQLNLPITRILSKCEVVNFGWKRGWIFLTVQNESLKVSFVPLLNMTHAAPSFPFFPL